MALPFTLAFPWALLALLLIPLLPRKQGWWWRVISLICLSLALAQPTLLRASNSLAVLVDVSDSVGEGALEAAAQFDFSELAIAPTNYVFASDTMTVAGDTAELRGFARGRTDIARALQVAYASGAKRILLISDGAESLGDTMLALPEIPIDSYRVASLSNTRLLSLLAPEQASPGETVEIIAVVQSDRDTEVTLRVNLGDEEMEPIVQRISRGQTPIRFSFRVQDERDVRVSARLDVPFEQPSADDAQSLNIAVNDQDPVLVINDPQIATLLRTQGFQVTEGSVADIVSPLAFSAIVLRESAKQFTPGQLELLASYVNNGGGLMMTGGPETFGLGAWYRTAVEDVLPVHTDLRSEVELPLVAMVIVLDRSQSMSGGRPSKINLAKEGAIGVVELAYQEDRLGLITFSDAAGWQWEFNLRKATERGKREMLQAILNIETQGGTVLGPALQAAVSTLRNSEAAIKHIIILSDGQLNDGGSVFSGNGSATDFSVMTALALAEGITTSTIAIGDGADFDRLEAIAISGGGRYYAALDVSTLPKIFTNEALTATRSLLREDVLSPTRRPHPFMPESTASVPILDAYIASSLKKDSELLLEGINNEPILAISRQGLGRSAALTTDLNSWAGPFGRWQELPALLGTITRWLQARPAEYSATVTPQGNKLKVVVDAVKDGQYINNQNLLVRFAGSEQRLEQTALGRYETLLPNEEVGGSLIISNGTEIVARSQVSAPNVEFETRGAATLMSNIASASGGVALSEPGLYTPDMPSDSTAIWHYFAMAGLAVFMLELVLRRVSGLRTSA